MPVIDKRGILKDIRGRSLDLGCGPIRRFPSYVGVDVLDYDSVDIVGDVFDVLQQIPDLSINAIYSEHFLEHIDDTERLLNQFGRVLTPGGALKIIVPHFSNPYFYSDMTHRTAFGLYSLAYFAEPGYFRRSVPTYQREIVFRIDNVELGFKSARPFYARHAVKKLIGAVVNSSTFAKEFYEENLSGLLPCYEVTYELTRK